MKEMERKSNKLILLILLLPLAVVLIAAGCKKKEGELYQFVITSVTKSESVTDSESMSSETSEITMESESAVPADTTAEETTEETTEETSEETTTKAEVKAETKKTTKATTKATAKAVKKTAKTTKKVTKTTTKKKKATPTPTPKPNFSGYLFVGDSRTVGLDEAVSGVSSIAKVGAGVTYFKSILPEVTKVRGKNVIFNFGVNDRDRYKDYVAVYKSLPKEFIQKANHRVTSQIQLQQMAAETVRPAFLFFTAFRCDTIKDKVKCQKKQKNQRRLQKLNRKAAHDLIRRDLRAVIEDAVLPGDAVAAAAEHIIEP